MDLAGLLRAPVSGVSQVWAADHPWATVYDFVVERERLARVAWRLGADSDVRELYRAAEEIGRQPSGAAILDIPCGGGVALRGLRPGQDVRYVAADISPAMLDRTAGKAARMGLTQVEPVIADAEALDFPDATFDLVVTFTGLHCFPHPEDAVHELARVLKPGGVLTGSAFLSDTGLRHAAMREGGRAAGLMGPSASERELRRWFPAAGLTGTRIKRSGPIAYFRATRTPGASG